MLTFKFSNLFSIHLLSSICILFAPFISCCYKFLANFEDPCFKLECNFGAECVRSKDGRTAKCVCPSKCYNYGDYFGSKPVCGSDGRNYPNECELRRQACIQVKNIAVKFQGKCDPCDEIQCPAAQICQLDETRNPICRCNVICSYDFKPVCASNGKTYINECTLRVEACKARKSLRILYLGECGSGRGINPCDILKCSIYQECDIDHYGIANCVCPSSCPLKLNLVCGSDGVTYDSECELQREACLKHKNVSVIYKGQCSEDSACKALKCDYGSICVINSFDLQPFCQCPSCNEEFKPVCGSDNISYPNECKLQKAGCEQHMNVYVVHPGPCNGCKEIKCEYYSLCKSDGNGNGQCVCPGNCTLIQSSICGSDGITYANECELRKASCQKKEYLTISYKNACDNCFNVHCKYGARCENGNCICPTDCPLTYDPVCSTEGVTYLNECQLRVTTCQVNSDVSIAFYGDCQESKGSELEIGTGYIKTCDYNTCRFGGICDYDAEGFPHCICSYQCPSKGSEEPVCGSDGRLYENECKLQEETCRRQQAIAIKDNSHCEESKVIPCYGETPLIDLSTGKDYYCGEEPEAKPCPSNSYCHESLKFAKCCFEHVKTKNCSKSIHGCCPDGVTSAQGIDNSSCSSLCNCNKLGSSSEICDPVTKQCSCKLGVGGLQCDRCEPGYWGLHKISEGNNGCIPCSCNSYGSVREDCDQMTGRCICKQALQGIKCDICPEDTNLDSKGCIHVSLTKISQASCSNFECKFGASCKQVSEYYVQCICNISCVLPMIKSNIFHKTSDVVCGTDGNTYLNECHLRLFACRMQKEINIAYKSQCLKEKANFNLLELITLDPVRRSTDFKITQQNIQKSFNYSSQISFKSTSKLPELPNLIKTPFFWGSSYIALPRLQAYTRLLIDLEFISYAEFGILLYNGQTKTGEGDFVSLSVNKGLIEFRYNLGSGKVILSSNERIKLGEPVKLVAKRNLQDGILSIVGQQDVFGKSFGNLKSLDLSENLFIGNVDKNISQIFENIGVNQGFVGCIKSLKIGHKNVDLTFSRQHSIKNQVKFFEVHDCEDMACYNHNPCLNNGICLPYLDKEGYELKKKFRCECNVQFGGRYCETKLNICMNENPCIKGSTCVNLPKGGFSCLCSQKNSTQLCSENKRKVENLFIADFWGTSYLVLPTLENIAKAFTIEVWFLTRDLNGLILYNGQESSNEKGDFISLNLINGVIEFKYNLGSRNPNTSGIVSLSTKKPISLCEWHSVRITRDKTKGSLQVDEGLVEFGEAKGQLNELNLNQPLFIGAVENLSLIHKESRISRGLSGAIQRITVNGEVWDDLVSRSLKKHNVIAYEGPPCGSQNPCPNESLCIPYFHNFDCK